MEMKSKSENEKAAAAPEAPRALRGHKWASDGFCVYCHNVHRTDFSARSICRFTKQPDAGNRVKPDATGAPRAEIRQDDSKFHIYTLPLGLYHCTCVTRQEAQRIASERFGLESQPESSAQPRTNWKRAFLNSLDVQDELKADLERVTAERDACLYAMREIIEWNSTRGKGRPAARALNRIADVARAAIAAVEKGSK